MSYDSYTHERNWGARVMEFDYRGYRMVALENRFIRVVVAVGKGTDILEFLYKPLDVDFMWRSYTGLHSFADFTPTVANPQGSFIDFYAGGWQEMLPNAGVDCNYKGASLGVHGEVCLLPWNYRIEHNEPDCVSVAFSVRTLRTPFFIEKTLGVNDQDPVLFIEEKVRNEAQEPMDLMWGHHPALGSPFLDDSCRLYLPPCRLRTPEQYTSPNSRLEKAQDTDWPFLMGKAGEAIDLSRIPSAEARSHDMAYMYQMQEGWYAVVNQNLRVGFGLRWDHTTFPFLWFWQLYRGGAGYPWYGMNYTLALEPVSSYPPTLTEAIKAGTQVVLAEGEERSTRLLAVAIAGSAEVHGIDDKGQIC